MAKIRDTLNPAMNLSIRSIFRVSAIPTLTLILASVLSVAAQKEGNNPGLRKYDEFGPIQNEDTMARLDFFTIELQKNSSLKGYVVVYGVAGKGPGSGNALLGALRNYLTERRGLTDSQLSTIYGGRNPPINLPRVELWIGKSTNPGPTIRQTRGPFEGFKGRFREFPEWDEIEGGEPEVDGSVLATGVDAAFAETLNRQRDSVAYLVAYNSKDATPGAWRRVGQKRIDALREYGITSDRVKLIFGGVSNETKSELWIQPKSDPPPVTIGPEPAPTKAILVASINEMMWEAYERGAMNRMVEILRNNKTLRVCLVVQLQSKSAGDNEGVAVSDSEETQKPKMDFVALPEKWRKELASKVKLTPDRFIVLMSEASEDSSSGIDVWIVPEGAKLPGPNDSDEDADPVGY